ncbi:hypothetical protein Pcinc_014041 [Petrolisthes cinctipes]|uniref:Uncharacterized protein n=1 Tax=Petrolisthes cinctipes TaxID=88211 RepID=A0AAE1FYK6_PETCI|nr:hypothetical protein Pcinc_014041 [Petrolisthes cinctipes]
MRYLVAIFLFIAATGAQQSSVTPGGSGNYQCPHEFGFYPHATACDKYYTCDAGVPTLKTCGNGLAFDASDPEFLKENCDYSHNVDCTGRPENEPAISTTNCPNLYGIFADPVNCAVFWSCWDGEASRYECTPGLAYDRVSRVCNWMDNIPECKAQRDAMQQNFACPAPGELAATGSFSRHPHPDDCRQYFVCLDGAAREYGCPIGTVFQIGNIDGLGQCSDPELVPGCEDYYGDLDLRVLRGDKPCSRKSHLGEESRRQLHHVYEVGAVNIEGNLTNTWEACECRKVVVMSRGRWVWVWMCLSLSYHTHCHSIHTDPHFTPHSHQGGEGGGGEGRHCRESASELSNHIALELQGGEDQARHLALKHHLHYVRQVFTDPPVFHLHKPVKNNNSSNSSARGCHSYGGSGGRRRRRRRALTPSLVHQLALEPEVRWVEQQKSYVRDKRDQLTHVPVSQIQILATHLNSSHIPVTPRHYIPAEVERNRVILDTILRRRHHVSGSEGRKDRLTDEDEILLEDWERKEEKVRVLEELAVGDGKSTTRNKMDKEERGRTHDMKHKKGSMTRKRRPTSHPKGKSENIGERKAYHEKNKLEGQLPEDGDQMSLVSLRKHTGTSLLRTLQTPINKHHQDHRHFQDRKHFPLDAVATPSVDNSKLSNKQQRVSACRGDNRHTKSTIPGSKNEAEFVSRERERGTGSQDHQNEGAATPWTAKYANDEAGSPGHSMVEFNDPLFKDQWYLVNTGQVGADGLDLNLTWAWLQGYTGKGVTVSILDDGIQTTNPDIAPNYASEVSYSVVQDGQPLDDPSPRLDPPAYTNSHGTYCTGIVAAVANNSVCGVGIAYEARVGGVRIVDGKVTDIQEATALSRHADIVDVFSASWGPTDDGTKVEGPGKLAQQALLYGITQGRGGRGAVYVWAAGNGGLLMDNCNLDGYTSSVYTLSVAALTPTGTSTYYSEPCASILAAVYIGGAHTMVEGQEGEQQLRVVVPELDGHCSEKFQGSSAAAPLMAGVVALALQANPELGWRDLQHLVVATAVPTPEALLEDGWTTNTLGRPFHLLQGFGAVNAGRLVEEALIWENVAPQKTANISLLYGSRPLPPGEWVNLTGSLSDADITSAEHVVATISLTHPQRRLLLIFIVSPGGTQSQILTQRPNDKSKEGFWSWDFLSVHFWGEDPRGKWKVAVKNGSGRRGYLREVHLQVYGT